MTDPFGTIATQVIGDLGIHIGQGSWAGSAHMTANVAAVINGPGAPGKPTLAPGSGYGPHAPSRLGIYDGSATHPVTTDSPSVLISRISAFNAPPANNDALFVYHQSASPANNATNTSVRGFSVQTDIGDSVGTEGTAIIDITAVGTGQVAYGLYGNAVDFKGSGYTVGANPTNQVSSSVPYVSPGTLGSYSSFAQVAIALKGSEITIASPGVISLINHQFNLNDPFKLITTGALPTGFSVGVQYYVKSIINADQFTASATPGGAVINTSGTQSGLHQVVGRQYLVSAAYAIFANNPPDAAYDVGFVAGLGVINQTFRDDTSSVTCFMDTGTHTDGIDLSAGTYSGSPIKLHGGVAYTPTVTPQSGAFTNVTAAGHYLLLGKFLYLSIVITQTSINTGANAILFSLPLSLTARDGASLSGYGTAGKSLMCQLATGTGVVLSSYYDGSSAIANGNFLVITGWVEVN